MVRLERVLYERIVNNKLIGRNRSIGSPKLWFTRRNTQNSMVFWPGSMLVNKILDPIYNFVTAMEYRQTYNLSKFKGIPFESFLSMREEDWRRGVLSEHLKRENLHAWVQVMHTHIRSRYYKIEKYQKGFQVPDQIVAETHAKPLIETMSYADSIQTIFWEYQHEMMPKVYWFRSIKMILDVVIFHNLFNRESWNRLFYNEVYYDKEIQDMEAEEIQKEKEIDMTDPKNQENFKNWMEARIKLYPGLFVREGETFDFETFFRDHAALNGFLKPSAEMTQEQIDNLKKEVSDRKMSNSLYSNTESKILRQDHGNEEIFERKNTVGIYPPQEITPIKYKAWMA